MTNRKEIIDCIKSWNNKIFSDPIFQDDKKIKAKIFKTSSNDQYLENWAKNQGFDFFCTEDDDLENIKNKYIDVCVNKFYGLSSTHLSYQCYYNSICNKLS
jgi:hypothetical protein